MPRLNIPYTSALNKTSSPDAVSQLLKTMESHPIECLPWPAYSYKPDATFSIAHSGDCIFVRYEVAEGAFRACSLKSNDPVYEDSCVELFIGFEREKAYYNFEFNAAGVCLAGWGEGREGRELLKEHLIAGISSQTDLKAVRLGGGGTKVHWCLTLIIPCSVFQFHDIKSFAGKSCRGNFYKCGDLLPEPHFLSWSPIVSEQPNFHLPEYFGELLFGCP